MLLVAAATPAGGSFTGAGAGAVGLKGGVEASADTCWGGCMGGSTESFTAPSAGGVDVAVIFEGPTSTSRVYVAGGGGTSLRASGFSEKLFRLQCVLRMIAHPLGLQLELSSTFELGD